MQSSAKFLSDGKRLTKQQQQQRVEDGVWFSSVGDRPISSHRSEYPESSAALRVHHHANRLLLQSVCTITALFKRHDLSSIFVCFEESSRTTHFVCLLAKLSVFYKKKLTVLVKFLLF